MLDTEWYERSAATGETQRIPDMQPLAARAPSQSDRIAEFIQANLGYILIFVLTLLAMNAMGILGNTHQNGVIQLQPPAQQTFYHIEDNSWNMCGICGTVNRTPHITIETRP